jgi:tetratricopeptide (TPR) repeat protein
MLNILRNIFLTATLLFSVNAAAQSVDSLIIQGKKLINNGCTQWEVTLMQKARAHFERLLADKKHEALVRYYLGYCDYRLATFYQQQTNKDMLAKHLEEAIKHLEAAVKLNNKLAEAYALLSSCYGQKIGLAPMLGMTLGPRAGMTMQSALQLEPNNPRVILLEAIGNYYKPPMFGGSKEVALAGFKRAAELFEKEQLKDPLQPDWGKPEAYAWIGVAYLDKNDNAAARAALEKALAVAPDYGWVKNYLFPKASETKQ